MTKPLNHSKMKQVTINIPIDLIDRMQQCRERTAIISNTQYILIALRDKLNQDLRELLNDG